MKAMQEQRLGAGGGNTEWKDWWGLSEGLKARQLREADSAK